jgi:signal transduction histidine kinase
VRLVVADDGTGIAPEHRARLFERFYRVDPARAAETGGAGLGLAIVARSVRLLGGQVAYEPNEPAGSRFVVVLEGGGRE